MGVALKKKKFSRSNQLCLCSDEGKNAFSAEKNDHSGFVQKAAGSDGDSETRLL